MAEVVSIKSLSNTLYGEARDGWWLFRGVSAEVVGKLCGLKVVKGFGGEKVSGFAERDECMYTPRLVKGGYKICITTKS